MDPSTCGCQSKGWHPASSLALGCPDALSQCHPGRALWAVLLLALQSWPGSSSCVLTELGGHVGRLQLAQVSVTSAGFTGVTPICVVAKILLLMRQSCFLPPPDLPKPATLNSDTLIFLQEERGKIQEGTNLRPHQWEPGLIEIVMRIQSQTNRQVGKTQSHRCDREIFASKGADLVLINVTRSLYPNCNGLGIRLEDSISVLLQYAGC